MHENGTSRSKAWLDVNISEILLTAVSSAPTVLQTDGRSDKKPAEVRSNPRCERYFGSSVKRTQKHLVVKRHLLCTSCVQWTFDRAHLPVEAEPVQYQNPEIAGA